MAVDWFEVDVKLGDLRDQMILDALSMTASISSVDPSSVRTIFYVKRTGDTTFENRVWALYRIDTTL